MRVIVFVVFTLVYVLTAVATLLAFLATAGLISTSLKAGSTIPYLGLLIGAVLVETAGGYIALAKNLFGLRTPNAPEVDKEVRDLTLTAMKVLSRAQSVAYQYATDLRGLMEKYGSYISRDIDLSKAKGRQQFILETSNEIENAIKEGENILRKGDIKKIRQMRDKLASFIEPLEKMILGAPALLSGTVGISEFRKLDMRVGEVKAADAVEDTDKLLKLVVDIAGETRQAVAGIGKAYKPNDLLGKRVVVLTNLQPQRIHGVESNGMVITAAAPGGRPALCTFTEPVNLGARLE